MTRREASLLVAFAAQLKAAPYSPRFFTKEEHRALDTLTELIIPTDDHSPGASAARVADFIDFLVANSPPSTQERWREGLQPYMKSSLEKVAVANDAFFLLLKQTTIHAYYTSEVGIRKELGYTGPAAISAFPACKA